MSTTYKCLDVLAFLHIKEETGSQGRKVQILGGMAPWERVIDSKSSIVQSRDIIYNESSSRYKSEEEKQLIQVENFTEEEPEPEVAEAEQLKQKEKEKLRMKLKLKESSKKKSPQFLEEHQLTTMVFGLQKNKAREAAMTKEMDSIYSHYVWDLMELNTCKLESLYGLYGLK